MRRIGTGEDERMQREWLSGSNEGTVVWVSAKWRGGGLRGDMPAFVNVVDLSMKCVTNV